MRSEAPNQSFEYVPLGPEARRVKDACMGSLIDFIYFVIETPWGGESKNDPNYLRIVYRLAPGKIL
jgi:hypothetical protein